MRSTGWALVVGLVAGAPAAALPGAEALRDAIAGKLGEALGAPVTVGAVELDGALVRLADVKLGDELAARAVEVAPDFASLFGGSLRVSRIAVKGVRGTVPARRRGLAIAKLFGGEVDLTADLDAVTVTGLERPLKIADGKLTWKGDALAVTPLVATVAGVRLAGSLRVADPAGDARLDLKLAGPVELGEHGARTVSGRGEVALTAHGPAAKPKVALALKAGTVRVSAGGRTFTLRDLRARPVPREGGLALEDLSAELGGARVTGRVVPGATTQLAVSVSGARLASLGLGGGRNGGARVDLTFAGTAGPGGVRGRGRATLTGASVDLSRDPQLAQHMRKVERGESGAAIVGLLLGSQAGAQLRDRADYYGEVLERLMAVHRLGPVKAEYVLTPGRLALDPISGPNLSGRARVTLGDGSLLGYLTSLRLAGVRLTGVRLTGSVANPRPQVDPDSVQLERTAQR